MLTLSSVPPEARARYEKWLALLRAKRDAASEAYRSALRAMPVAEDGRQHRLERRIQEIILSLESLGDLMPGDLAHNLRVSRATIHRCLRICVERGILKAKGFGLYTLPEDHIKTTEADGLKAFNRKVLGEAEYPEKPSQRSKPRKKLPGRK